MIADDVENSFALYGKYAGWLHFEFDIL